MEYRVKLHPYGPWGMYKNYVYALAIPLDFGQYNIAHLEMLNVVMALKV